MAAGISQRFREHGESRVVKFAAAAPFGRGNPQPPEHGGAERPPYSARSAIIGSTRVARRAGTSVAVTATSVMSARTTV